MQAYQEGFIRFAIESDVLLYRRSPIYLMRGELIDPMPHVQSH